MEFLRLLKARELDKAYELTTKAGLVGADAAAFQKKVAGECLEGRGVSYMFPPQTNGNRLRRWIYRRDVEMPEVGVEFEDPLCPVRMTLRRDQNKKWKVYFLKATHSKIVFCLYVLLHDFAGIHAPKHALFDIAVVAAGIDFAPVAITA